MAPMAGIEPVTGAFVTQQIGCVGAVQIIHTCASSMRTSPPPFAMLEPVAVAGAVLASAASSNATVWTSCSAPTASCCPCVVGGRAGSMPAQPPPLSAVAT